MRNPWGHFSWSGDWSQKSDIWTPELRERLGQHSCQDDTGVFWIAFEDVLKYFDCIDICKVKFVPSSDIKWDAGAGGLE